MLNINDCYRFLIILIACGLLSACGSDVDDLEKFVQEAISQPPGQIEPIPEFQPYENFEYTSHDLLDPFRLVGLNQSGDDSDADNELNPANSGRVREPLESFPLDTLRLKGSVTQDGVKWGLIFAPDNTVHRVIEGQYIGQNYGRIVSVTDQSIELIEIIPDGLGNYIERSSALALVE